MTRLPFPLVPRDLRASRRSITSRASLGLLALLASAALAGCIRHPPVARLPRPTPIALAYVVSSPFTPRLQPAPAELKRGLCDVLHQRNLVGQELAPAVYLDEFSRLRDSRARREALARLAPGAPYLLFVETQASFYSQLAGRYKWDVEVRLSLWRRGSAESLTEDRFEVPAFLLYAHQKEQAALAEVTSPLARRVADLVDSFFAANPAPQAPR